MKLLILDVRQPAVFERDHVEGAKNIPAEELMTVGLQPTLLDEVDKNTRIIVYCDVGKLSGEVQEFLTQQGYKNVINGVSRQHVEEFIKQKQ
ncbi:MAG TPA: rhodanese-like domain-containing protein [Candidatus Saccharimonadales bacterium]|nr:rhodanese-like domain-containing protein [Candidatus Saccharimonadales bacterium]